MICRWGEGKDFLQTSYRGNGSLAWENEWSSFTLLDIIENLTSTRSTTWDTKHNFWIVCQITTFEISATMQAKLGWEFHTCAELTLWLPATHNSSAHRTRCFAASTETLQVSLCKKFRSRSFLQSMTKCFWAWVVYLNCVQQLIDLFHSRDWSVSKIWLLWLLFSCKFWKKIENSEKVLPLPNSPFLCRFAQVAGNRWLQWNKLCLISTWLKPRKFCAYFLMSSVSAWARFDGVSSCYMYLVDFGHYTPLGSFTCMK